MRGEEMEREKKRHYPGIKAAALTLLWVAALANACEYEGYRRESLSKAGAIAIDFLDDSTSEDPDDVGYCLPPVRLSPRRRYTSVPTPGPPRCGGAHLAQS